MRDTRLQFFLTLAMLGTVLPYVSVFFRHAGLDNAQVGYAYAIYGLASVISPAVVTMLADRRGDPRKLLAALNALTALLLILLSQARGVFPSLALWTLYSLASVPIFPLLNGIHFGQQQRRRECARPQMAYHQVRAWGTVGYISVSLALFPFMHFGLGLGGVLIVGAGIAAISSAQSFLLDDPRRLPASRLDRDDDRETRLPALQAIRALLGPRLFAFTAAVILVSMISQIHAAFYPIYLTERIKVADEWLGQASNVAVFVEAILLFSCGWLTVRLGLKPLLLLCILATALRMALLASTNNVWIAIGSQVFHGLMILTIGVLPQALLNDHAAERYRHSMQGMLVMLTSAGQCVASLGAGCIATHSLSAVYTCATLLGLIAAALVLYGFNEQSVEGEVESTPEPTGALLPMAS